MVDRWPRYRERPSNDRHNRPGIERRGVGGQAAQSLFSLLLLEFSCQKKRARRARSVSRRKEVDGEGEGRGGGEREAGSLENRFCRRISKDWRGGVVGVKGLRESSSVNYLYQSLEIHSSKEDDFIV